MADVFAVFGTLLALGIAFPGMLTAWWLLFPKTVEGASTRLSQTPGRCLGFGGIVTIALAFPIAILLALPLSFAKMLGVMGIFLLLGYSSLGAAGMAAELGRRLSALSREGLSKAGGVVRGAIVLELAAVFPIIGWFIFIPLTVIASLGASTFAVLRWLPGERASLTPDANPSQA